MLEAEIAAETEPTAEDWEALAALYQTEGRDRERRMAERRAELLRGR
jgi:hypothetical protein